MLKFSWRNGLAVGLTIGVCLATLLILLGQAIYDLAKCNQNNQCDRYAAQYENQDLPEWWWWDWEGSLVTSDDTLAQWIMAFFTIGAVLLIWRTLVATQVMVADTRRMASETKEIGDKQVANARAQTAQAIRPWLMVIMSGDMVSHDEYFERLSVAIKSGGRVGLHILTRLNIMNVGSTPATIVGVWYGVRRETPIEIDEMGPVSENMTDQEIFHVIRPSGQIQIAGNLGVVQQDTADLGFGVADYLNFNEAGRERLTGSRIQFVGWVKYCDPVGNLYLKSFAFEIMATKLPTYMPWGGIERNYEESLNQEA